MLSTHTDIITCMHIYTTSDAYTIYASKILLVSHTEHHVILNTSARQTTYYYLGDKLSSLEKTKGSGELSVISLKLASLPGTLVHRLVRGEVIALMLLSYMQSPLAGLRQLGGLFRFCHSSYRDSHRCNCTVFQM